MFIIVEEIKQRYNFMVSLLIAGCLTAGVGVLSCQQQHLRRQPPRESISFWTPSGDIKEGSSMAEVVAVLGHPHHVDPQGRFELWQYDFNKERRAYVVFEKGCLYWVKFEQEP